MRRLIIYILLFTLFVGFLTVVKTRSSSNLIPQKQVKEIKIDENKLFDLVQKYRFDNYLQPFMKSDFLCKVTTQRLRETKINWAHDGFEADRFCKSCTLGENLSRYFNDENSTLNGWLSSPDHKAELDSKYTHSCLKCSDDNYCVETFGYY